MHAKVFTFTPDFDTAINAEEIITGGTGYKDFGSLPPEIEACPPDYTLYPQWKSAIGLLNGDNQLSQKIRDTIRLCSRSHIFFCCGRVREPALVPRVNVLINGTQRKLSITLGSCHRGVTEFMCVFGVVPSNFRQVEAPAVYCNVLSGLTGGTQFVNQADVGGVYNGQWIMATDRWVTTVYKPSKPRSRTGY